MGDHRETIDYDIGDATYEEERQDARYHDECHSEGQSFASSEGTSVSEIAGQRLYAQALETRRKIEEAREKSLIYQPRLDIATRGHRSREPSPNRPRYLQLYEHSKERRTPEPPQQEEFVPLKSPKDILPNEGLSLIHI